MAERIDEVPQNNSEYTTESVDGRALEPRPEYIDDTSGEGIEPRAVPDIKIDPGFLPNDVVLVVQDIRLHVNKDLLVEASPVFAAWLKKEWQNDQHVDNTKPELLFPGKSYDDVITFLKCLLPLFPDTVTDETLDIVLPLADEYQAEALITECEEAIRECVKSVYNTDTYIPPSRIVTYVLWVEQFKLHTVKKTVVRLASYLKSEELEAVPDYESVSTILQREIYKAREELLGRLFVSNATEAEEKMHQLKIPRSYRYMTEWKQMLEKLVEREVKGYTNFESKDDRNYRRRPTIDSDTAAMFACLSIGDRFAFSRSYGRCLDILSSLNTRMFIKLWSMHYSNPSCKEQRDCIDRHLLEMHKRT